MLAKVDQLLTQNFCFKNAVCVLRAKRSISPCVLYMFVVVLVFVLGFWWTSYWLSRRESVDYLSTLHHIYIDLEYRYRYRERGTTTLRETDRQIGGAFKPKNPLQKNIFGMGPSCPPRDNLKETAKTSPNESRSVSMASKKMVKDVCMDTAVLDDRRHTKTTPSSSVVSFLPPLHAGLSPLCVVSWQLKGPQAFCAFSELFRAAAVTQTLCLHFRGLKRRLPPINQHVLDKF